MRAVRAEVNSSVGGNLENSLWFPVRAMKSDVKINFRFGRCACGQKNKIAKKCTQQMVWKDDLYLGFRRVVMKLFYRLIAVPTI